MAIWYPLGGYLFFALALHTVRVRTTEDGVVVSAFDPMPLAMGFPVILLLAAVAAWLGYWPVGGAMLALATSARHRLTLTSDEVVHTHLLGPLPVRERRHSGRGRLLVDGWGDEIDPLALRVQVGPDSRHPDIELGWVVGRGGQARAERLVAQAEEAITTWTPRP